MKALTNSVKLIGASLVFLALAACGKSDSGNNNVAAVNYANQNGTCYDTTHNTPVTMSYCNGVGTTGQFAYQGNICVSTSNNQQVDPVYCQQSLYGNQYGGAGYGGVGYGGAGYGGSYGYGGTYTVGNPYAYGGGYGASYFPGGSYGGGYGGSQTCIGTYFTSFNGYGGSQIVCNGVGVCSGQFLYNIQTRTAVHCL